MNNHASDVERDRSTDDWPASCFESVDTCPWCFGIDLVTEIEGVRDWFFECVPGSFSFARCGDCSSLVLQRRPQVECIGRAYANYYTHTPPAGHVRPSFAQRAKMRVSSSYVQMRYADGGGVTEAMLGRLYRLFPGRRREIDVRFRFLPQQPGKVLDYGCGNGSFLLRAKKLGHRVSGVDFDIEAVRAAKRAGVDVMLPAHADAVFKPDQFDHVSAAHVLEHLPDPKPLLGDFRRWTKQGGILFIELPNPHAAGLARFGRFWRGLEAPRHFSIPSKKALKAALIAAGFAQVCFHPRSSVRDWLWVESEGAVRRACEELEPCGRHSNFEAEEFLTVTASAD